MTQTSLSVDALEDRLAPAVFGIPWPTAERLTLSFAPDGTPIAGHANELFQALDAIAPTPVWQREILRAFQTWAVHANINVGVRPDGGQPFGTAGRPYADPRFADVRIGAHRMARDALATSVPFAPVFSGTYTGDVFVNSAARFTVDRLFATMLHEAGHVLGLGHSDDSASPMFAHLNTLARLTAGDVAALQELYGVRTPDRHEGPQGNEDFDTATPFEQPRFYDGVAPLVLFGDVTTPADSDVFVLRSLAHYDGPVTIRLQTAGVSLLAPRLTVFDAAGNVLSAAASAEPFGAIVSVRLDQVDPAAQYLVRVEAAACDEFGVGAYGLAVSHEAVQQVPADALDRFLSGPNHGFTPEETDALLRDPTGALVAEDRRGNDDFTSATLLRQRTSTVFDALGSLSDAADADFYRVLTVPGQNGRLPVLTVTAWGITDNAVAPRVNVFTANRRPAPAEVLVNGNGTFAVELVGAPPGGFVYLHLAAPAGAADQVGNYALHVRFTDRAAELVTFASGDLDESQPGRSQTLYVGRSQLFQFVLSATDASVEPGTPVSMSVSDSQGREVFRLESAAGDAVSGSSLFLPPGAYTVTFATATPPPGRTLGYRLRGQALSDPVGPGLEDPTLRPMYQAPNDPTLFIYPGPIQSIDPFLWLVLV